ncbi:hypothetical protein C1646_767305 [Rhizophagus diaphanus]|nr:hypothetical protein C1646_767305 [Rhizophagus diaphanus] [Rhizophagus sp. MUCL 43196]
MTCSKIISGDLPELTYEIIQYLRNDISTLYSCILVNRLWCRLTIPLLWEDPFSIKGSKNYHFIEIYLKYDDCDYFNIAFKLILQNQSFIHKIKNLNLTIYSAPRINITSIIPYLKSINTISSLYYNFYGHSYNPQNINKIHLSQIINSQKNSKKLIITFRKIVFNDTFNEVFEQLNVLESIHIIDCKVLNSFIQQILDITKPFKLKTLFMKKELPNIDLLQLLLQKSGNYIENVSFGPLMNSDTDTKRKSFELITRYCKKIQFLELLGFDHQNIYSLLLFNLVQNLNYLSIYYIDANLFVLQNLDQILPFKLEYLNLDFFIENANNFEIFLSIDYVLKLGCVKVLIFYHI